MRVNNWKKNVKAIKNKSLPSPEKPIPQVKGIFILTNCMKSNPAFIIQYRLDLHMASGHNHFKHTMKAFII